MGRRPRKPARKSGWRQWKAKDAQRIMDAWRASGLPLAPFARRRGLTPERLRWWRHRLGDWGARDAAPTVSLVPAVIRGDRLPFAVPLGDRAASGVVTVRVGEAIIEVANVNEVPASWLGALVSALARPAA
jgi:hypothetical protein